MKEGWQEKSLGDVCVVDKRQGLYRHLPYVGLENIESHTGRFIGSIAPFGVKSSTFKFSPHHLLYGRLRPYLNKVLLPDFIGHCSTEIFPIKPASELLREFLKYWFLRDETAVRINATCTGARMPRANMNAVLDFEFLLPPIPEQLRIVGILDKAFNNIATAKANAEKNLQNARALFESHLNAIFTQRGKGWVEKTLGEISKINYGYTESASAEPVGPKFLRITDIQDGRVNWDTVPYCPISASDLPKYKLAVGDIVFARTGATTGKSYLITEPPDAVFASYLIRVQLAAKELLPPFLFLFFQTMSYWDCIKSGSSGSAQGGFNATKLGELVIPYPKVPKAQQSIIAKLEGLSVETQRLVSIYQQKLSALDELKKSLLHQAFTGAL